MILAGTLRRAGLSMVAATVLAGAGCGGGGKVDCDKPGVICTLAGTGSAGNGAAGQAALETDLDTPLDVTTGPNGHLFIIDWNNHRIRELMPDGTLRTVVGIGELSPGQEPELDRLNHPSDVTFNAAGQMVIAAWHNSKIKTVDVASGVVTDVCGTGKRAFGGDGMPAAMADLNLPVGVLFDKDGNMLISDQANMRIRKVDAAGIITTVYGTGPCMTPMPTCFAGDGGPAAMAQWDLPGGQAASPKGKMAMDGDGNLYLADTNNNRVRKIDAAGVITTVVGTGERGSAGDGGPAIAAQLNRPSEVDVGPDGALYVADTENDCVRRVGSDGVIATVAGVCCKDPASCAHAFSGDGDAATAAHLNRPFGVGFDKDGNMLVADSANNRVRVVHK